MENSAHSFTEGAEVEDMPSAKPVSEWQMFRKYVRSSLILGAMQFFKGAFVVVFGTIVCKLYYEVIMILWHSVNFGIWK